MAKYPLPILSSLKAFEAAARHESIKRASEELHVTHAAVSRHIAKVELLLGRRLFIRHHRRIVLTDAGETLLRAVSLGLTQIQRAFAQLKRNGQCERLVISVDPDFAGLWLVPRLAEFSAIAPNILVEISAEKRLNPPGESGIDCAIQYAEAGLRLDNGELLFRSRLFPVCAPAPRQAQPLRSPRDLRHHMLLHDRSIVEWQEFLQSCPMTVDVDVRLGTVFSDTFLCMEAAARGQGIAIGDDFLAAMHLSEGRLVVPFDSGFHSKNAYYFFAPERTERHSAVGAFRNWLFQSIDRLRNDSSVRHCSKC